MSLSSTPPLTSPSPSSPSPFSSPPSTSSKLQHPRRHRSLSSPPSLLLSCALITATLFTFRYFLYPPLLRRFQSFNPSSSTHPSLYTFRSVFPTPFSSSSSPSAHPPVPDHDVCLLLSHDPLSHTLWPHNSRMLCVTSSLCFPTPSSSTPSSSNSFFSAYSKTFANSLLHTSNFSRTLCRLVSPQYDLYISPPNLTSIDPTFLSCPQVHQSFQLCPMVNGTDLLLTSCQTPTQPTTHQVLTALQHKPSTLVLHGLTLIVPNYAYPANIFHYAASISFVAHVAANIMTILQHFNAGQTTASPSSKLSLPPNTTIFDYPLNILFLHPRRSRIPWRQSLLTALERGRMSRVLPKGVQFYYLPEIQHQHVCAKNPVNLGRRGHVNSWPFPNASAVHIDGTQVPRDAVEFRADVYDSVLIHPPPFFNFSSTNSTYTSHDNDAPQIVGTIPIPPLVVGYSRRAGRASKIGLGVHAAGTTRRFSESDEAWFTAMLRNETQSAGLELVELLITQDDSFAQQVRTFAELGFVVGIHGANLVNSLFMRPFSTILEIFPANVESYCYIAGANNGLAYLSHYALVEATPEETGCAPEETVCWKVKRQRMVKIGTEQDRKQIIDKVRAGIQHLILLHKLYGKRGEVPVKYDRLNGLYVIADEQFSSPVSLIPRSILRTTDDSDSSLSTIIDKDNDDEGDDEG